jgi:beta-ribofuranosylaminobenzene 5'-phosphate synthase
MEIEIAAPASLPLGLVRLEQNNEARVALLGITLQYPPVHLLARPSVGLNVTGARADKAYEQTQRFLERHGLESGAEVEIELAIPSLMGLGSEAMLGLSVARALVRLKPELHQLPMDNAPALAHAIGLGPEYALEIWGFDQGGLLLVEDTQDQSGAFPEIIHRHEISHPEADAWAFVLHFPHAPADTPKTWEADCRLNLLKAAPHVSEETGHVFQAELWPAVQRDDLPTFGRALLTIQQLNQHALAHAGTPQMLTSGAQPVLDLMQENGAVAWGQSLTGLARYGLVRGASDSIELRKKVQAHVGLYGGTVMASICDNAGARRKVGDRS